MIRIRSARMGDAAGLNHCVGRVAAERRFLAMVKGPSLRDSRRWLRSMLASGNPLLVVVDGARVVGWCDVLLRNAEGFRHSAGLGMGLLPDYRGRGLGGRLLRRAVAASRRRGIEKLELQVYASNRPAYALYLKRGFKVEGRRRRARKLEGRYDDIIHMGRFLRRRPRR